MTSGFPAALGRPLASGRTAEVFPWPNGWVLKLYRPGWGRREAEHEAQVTRAAHAAKLPAPAVGDVVEISGRAGLLLGRADGPSLLSLLVRKPWTVGYAARLMAQLHAEMHEQSVPDLPPLRSRLDGRIRAARLPSDVEASILRRLAHLPDGERICHGDFHPDNIIMTSRGPIIIDWVDACRGDPAADVARTLLLARIATPSGLLARILTDLARSRFCALYLREYLRRRHQPADSIYAWLPVVAAGRWREGVEGEHRALERMIHRGQAPRK